MSSSVMLSSIIKYESISSGVIKSSKDDFKLKKPQVPIIATNNTNDSNVATKSNNIRNLNNSNSKMSSRRIFTPHFKLQVLESYRNDSDCKGNQRATARKYNIHRRQIQKWLQCESNIRSSVANINQNNIKYDFDNVSYRHQQIHVQMSPKASASDGRYSKPYQSPLDTAIQNVALNSSALPLMDAIPIAAATHTSLPTAVSTLRQTTIDAIKDATVPSMLHSQHHQYRYSISCTHTPAFATVSIPIPTRFIPSQFSHHYKYQNISHCPNALVHSQQPPECLPTASLPMAAVLSAPAFDTAKAKNTVALIDNKQEENKNSYDFALKTLRRNETGNKYSHNDKESVYCNEEFKSEKYETVLSVPIDLSIRTGFGEHGCHEDLDFHSYTNTIDSYTANKDIVVDLTFRKRKLITDDESLNIEVVKFEEKKDSDEAKIDDEKRKSLKPIKLFKPYLLDEVKSDKSSYAQYCKIEHREPIICSHPACVLPHIYESRPESSRGSTFNSSDLERYLFPVTGSCICKQSESSHSTSKLFSGCLACPKGSPVSGYESSSSTYSDSSSSEKVGENFYNRAYSIDVELQPIYIEKIINTNHIHKWLDQEANKSKSAPNASVSICI